MLKNILKIILLVPALAWGSANENRIVKEIEPYTRNDIRTPAQMVFNDDGTYLQLSQDGKTIDKYDVASGNKIETLFDATHTREKTVAKIEGFKVFFKGTKILVWTDSKPIYRRSTTARYFVYDLHSRVLMPLADGMDCVQCPVIAPTGHMIAFVYENNIYIRKLDYNTQVAVTTDGKAGSIINGATDWTYEEEFNRLSLMAFTPDNSTLCFVKTNETEVPEYHLPLYAGVCNRNDDYALYPGLLSYKYPVAGANNSKVTLHAYEISNRKIKDIELPDKNIEYIPRIDFIPESDNILVTTLNRNQNRLEIYSVNPKTTISTSVFVEQSDAWILPSAYEELTVMKDGFVIQSNRDEWTHLYKYALNGTLTRTITSGQMDVTAFYGMDAEGNAYYQAATPTPLDRTVWRVDAKGVKTALSKDNGTTDATFSPDCRYAVMSYSDVNTPPVYTLSTSKGKTLRTLVDNADIKAKLTTVATKEFLTVPGQDGLTFNAYVIKPSNFDSTRRYPVIMYQYSGPGSQTVLNKWSVTWEHYFASKGYVVFCLDGRGTGGRGNKFMYSVYKNLGYYETIDQLAGARWLSSQSWVDSKRIGMHGWSYGGYETLMCMQADNSPFAAGVAIAPVTDWRFYDTVYAERYMLTPQQNFDGYRVSAPLNFTQKMNGRLLLMAGTSDDNVHPANTYEYAAALQSDGVLFDMMMFPGKNHSIYGCNARAVVYGNMFRFFNDALTSK
ncbi:MAG: S9 family peptidase [Muribaculaceae bacterium]|nr:S9 family peptidase [Muribaculaceae bacterium]